MLRLEVFKILYITAVVLLLKISIKWNQIEYIGAVALLPGTNHLKEKGFTNLMSIVKPS